jgi:hypothetical protein
MGSLFIEFCGKTYIKSETTNLISEIEFKSKPFFGGQVNEVEAIIRDLKEKKGNLWQIEGHFDKKLFVKNRGLIKKKRGEDKRVLLDIEQIKDKKLVKNIPPLKDQRNNESQKLWFALTESIRKKDIMGASKAKYDIEEEQRVLRKKYEDDGREWKPKFFRQKKNESSVKGKIKV